MPTIGIIANPASGKDIRRLVSYATTIDNREKVNIVKRITLAAQSMGIDRILFMPDTFQIGRTVMSDLARDGLLEAELCVLDMPITASYEDTIRAAELMEAMGAGCCVVLGGDGTSRAAAKGLDETPILPVSTGTNNVYPTLTEGTVAGMAAAAAAILGPSENCRIRDKRIEISINGRFADIALVDAVITADLWVGAKAIWDTGKLRRVIATRCHPASIGFSSVAGCVGVVRDTDDFGVDAVLGDTGERVLAPVAAGVLSPVRLSHIERMPLDRPLNIPLSEPCMIALDGERELRGRRGDVLTFTVTRRGPQRVKIREALEEAVARGLFRFGADPHHPKQEVF